MDNIRREIDDARRSVDEKSEQLKAISHISALIAGFAMVVLVEVELPGTTPFWLLISFALSSAMVVCLMLVAMLNCTMILVCILKFDSVRRDPAFKTFWTIRCENDWLNGYWAFNRGVATFVIMLISLGWIKFEAFSSWSRYVPASCVTLVSVITGLQWYLHTFHKYNKWNKNQAEAEPQPLPKS